MKTAQYVRQERAIAAADSGGIRERWLWGLRLLRDPDAFANGGTQLRPGYADGIVAAVKTAGRKLSQREIQYRLRAARTYQTDSQIAQISARFDNWSGLIAADFPAVDAAEGEGVADHRTEDERRRDHARALADAVGVQGALFPLSDFEPVTTTLKDLITYATEMSELTARFARRDQDRWAYLNRLVEVAEADLSITWAEAHARLGDGTEIGQVAA